MAIDSKHPHFPGPEEEEVLWRYSTLTKLLAMLTQRALFLPSLRSLRADDPFEGLSTTADRKFALRLREDPDFAEQFCQETFPEIEKSSRAVFIESFAAIYGGEGLRLADTCFVSCWHAKKHEFAALWKLYSETRSGVAVRTTVARMRSAFDESEHFILSSVRYEDFETATTDFTNGLTPVFMKRNSYEHEHEVRLLRWNSSLVETTAGISIPCDPSELIEEIVVSPYAEQWMVETIRGVVAQMGFDMPVRKSLLMDTSF
ncbi:hypothetical protein [Devosia riboflavina]